MKYSKILTILFLLASATCTFGQTEWTVVDEMTWPVARGQVVVNNNVIYILGGYSSIEQRTVDWIQKYNPKIAGVWKIYCNMQFPRDGLLADKLNDGIYYFGGMLSGQLDDTTMEKYVYSRQSNIVGQNKNFERMYSTGLIFDGNFIIIGGNPSSGNSFLPYIVSYNIQYNNLNILENKSFQNRELPEHQMCARIDNNVYIFGGVIYSVSQDIYKFDLNTNSLSKLPASLLQPRAAGAAVVYPGTDKILIIGGFNENNKSLNTVEIFSITPSGYEIARGPSLNFPRSSCMTGVTSNAIYVIGGSDQNGDVIPQVELMEYDVTTVIDDDPEVITDFQLLQNYPNPFNMLTNINIDIKEDTEFSLDIYSVLGEHIINLTNDYYAAGTHSFQWNGQDKNGIDMPSGIYFYRFTSNSISLSKKMILLK